ncbi:class I SAM-dependent DNA methyltransferase [Desulfosoma caldarium]|uniref:Methyltransferase family protein n=1 Tax=Desulfosoma caldarium TaxID=610254 RepID=A0A3N1ULT7_9BACT|nr:methyltransferase domain-containing protein [Desulfosoma caldarium]ROQ92184.1 methyltransferase family protein [Desulfosoma caldarium]
MKRQRYQIKFPPTKPHQLEQDQSFFYLYENDQEITLRFHDYAELYKRPGLYEQLFYQRLRCRSPQKVVEILSKVLKENGVEMAELRVLDLGAGNGMVGELLQVARVIGVDIIEEAYLACERDRPGVYDAYYVADMSNLDASIEEELKDWQIDCLTCVAALGFGDIPVSAFMTAFNFVEVGGWIAFNIKETFLQESDETGFSRLTKYLLMSDTLEVHHLERYRHRISIDGRPLFYYALVGKKMSHISPKVMHDFESAT